MSNMLLESVSLMKCSQHGGLKYKCPDTYTNVL